MEKDQEKRKHRLLFTLNAELVRGFKLWGPYARFY